MNSKCVIVLGMHRSGTSALGGVLSRLGVDFGDRLLPAKEGENPKGYWEHRDLVSLDNEVLQALDSRWDAIDPLEENWWKNPLLSEFQFKFRSILERDFSHSAIWGLKDPRLCLLLPLWQPTLAKVNFSVQYALLLRDPSEVAKSLSVRDGLSGLGATLLWLEHVLAMERHTRGFSRCWLRYEDLLFDWRKALEPLLNPTGDFGLRLNKTKESAVDSFLDHELRHHQQSEVLAEATIPQKLAQNLYAEFPTLLTSGQLEERFATATASLQSYREEIAPWLAVLRIESRKHHHEVERLEKLISSQESEISRIKATATWKFGRPFRLLRNLIIAPQQTLDELALRLHGATPTTREKVRLPSDEE